MMRYGRQLDVWVASVAFFVTLVMVTSNVLLRYIAGRSLLFSEEIAYLGFAYSVFIGASLLYRQRALIAVDFLVDALPAAIQKSVQIATLVLLLVTCVAMIYIGSILVSDGFVRRTAYLQMPYAYLHAAPVIAFVLMAAYTLRFLKEAITDGPASSAGSAETR